MWARACARTLSTARTAIQAARVRIPDSVEVTKQAEQLIFSGPLGTSRLALNKIDSQGVSAVKLGPEGDDKFVHLVSPDKAFLGTFKSLVQNKIEGVSRGYLAYLRIVGVGYRASLQGQTLTFKVGYSHDVQFTLPDSIRALLPESTLVCLYGIDKNQVTQAAANIRAIKPPDPYKGKGIRLADEVIQLKPGKKAGKK